MIERKKFDALWEAERQKKIVREESDKSRQRQLDKEMLSMLDEQIAQLRVQAEKEEELKREESLLMVSRLLRNLPLDSINRTS